MKDFVIAFNILSEKRYIRDTSILSWIVEVLGIYSPECLRHCSWEEIQRVARCIKPGPRKLFLKATINSSDSDDIDGLVKSKMSMTKSMRFSGNIISAIYLHEKYDLEDKKNMFFSEKEMKKFESDYCDEMQRALNNGMSWMDWVNKGGLEGDEATGRNQADVSDDESQGGELSDSDFF